jgi:hypothetical protein
MLKRTFLAAILLASAVPAKAPDLFFPADVDKLNTFANHYNLYVTALRAGHIDTKEWKRVEGAWAALRGAR